MGRRVKDLTGQVFGRLTVVSLVEVTRGARRNAVWLCKCACGEQVHVPAPNLIYQHTTSCGCWAREQKTLPAGMAVFRLMLRNYKHSAKRKGRAFTLTTDECSMLFGGNCHYCGTPPDTAYGGKAVERYNGHFFANGIDRVDSSVGYIASNCVSCCKICNRAKHSMTVVGFEAWLNRVAAFRNTKGAEAVAPTPHVL
jgi:hypothetical protein